MDTLRLPENRLEVGATPRVGVVLPERLLTVREVAARLSVCRATVYKLVERGELPHVRIAGAVRVHPGDLDSAIERMHRDR